MFEFRPELLQGSLFERLRAYGNNTIVPELSGLIISDNSYDSDSEYINDIMKIKSSLVLRMISITGKNTFRNVTVDAEMSLVVARIALGYLSIPPMSFWTSPIRFDQTIADGIEQRTPAWYEARKRFITASEIGTVLGYNENETPSKYLRSKFSDKDPFSPFAYEHMNRGTCFEDVIVQIFVHLTESSDIVETGLIPSPEHNFLAASPDGYIQKLGPQFCNLPFPDALLEVKCRSARIKVTGIPKPSYWWQTQLQMHCAQKTQCIFIEGKVGFFADREAFLTDITENPSDTPVIDFESLMAQESNSKAFELPPPSPEIDPSTIPPQEKFNEKMLRTKNGIPKGIVVVAGKRQRDFVYEHVSAELDIAAQIRMSHLIENKYREQGYEDVEIQYWYLEDMAWSVIFRDDATFSAAIPKVQRFHTENF